MVARNIKCPNCRQPVFVSAQSHGRWDCPHCETRFHHDPIPVPGAARTAIFFGLGLTVMIAAAIVFIGWSLTVDDYGSDMWEKEAERQAEEARKKREAELAPQLFRSEKYGFEITFPTKFNAAGLRLTCHADGGQFEFNTHQLPTSGEHKLGQHAGRFNSSLEGTTFEEWRIGSTKACLVRWGINSDSYTTQKTGAAIEIVTDTHVFVASCHRIRSPLKDEDLAFLFSFRLLEGPDAGKAPERVE